MQRNDIDKMYNNIKIGLLGGDLRQVALAKKLASMGFETAVWGLGVGGSDMLGEAVKCVDFRSAISSSSAVILPLPISADGLRVNCPLAKDSEELRLTQLVGLLEKNTIVLAGRLTDETRAVFDSGGIKIIDYYESEELQIKNAVPTAEGALAIAMNELPVTIRKSKCAVLGYGRIGKVLAEMLNNMGADVTVAARKSTDRVWAETVGCNSEDFKEFFKSDEKFNVIFNTVPSCIIGKEELSKIPLDTLIIDLAASPGGIDVKAVRESGHKVIWALSLPGKCSPFTAGEIIGDTIVDILRREGVVS